MMDEHLYSSLKWSAILLTLIWVGWTFYDSFFVQITPEDRAYLAGNNFFADGHYENALQAYEKALHDNSTHLPALRGKARSLLQLNRYQEALPIFNQAIQIEPQFAGTYANRGILYDRMGWHEEALADYERALQMNSELGAGPSWLTRFFRLQPEKPPTIVERARYLREQLAKPETERLLRLPEVDDKQRPYQK